MPPPGPSLLQSSLYDNCPQTLGHRLIISLHPEDGEWGDYAIYPNCLPPKTIRGLFGEVMCGIFAENYSLVGGKTWRVPIFQFREHAPVARYIFDLVRDPTRVKEVHGRPGNDFIGLELAEDGTVLAYIAGEAKWIVAFHLEKLGEGAFSVKGDLPLTVPYLRVSRVRTEDVRS
jgi:hypothetical protein